MPKYKEIIRTSKHTLKFANTGKQKEISDFLNEFGLAVQGFIKFLWNNPVEFKSTKVVSEINEITKEAEKIQVEVIKTLDIQRNSFDCPLFFDYKICEVSDKLSSRALSSAITMACGIVKSQTRKIQKLQGTIKYLNGKTQSEETERAIKSKEKSLDHALKNLKMPNLFEKQRKIIKFRKNKKSKRSILLINSSFLKAELSSKNITIEEPDQAIGFDIWISLKSLGPNFKNIDIPVKLHRQALHWKKQGFELKGSVLLCEDHIELRWAKKIEKVEEGEEIGCDTGVNSCVTFSNQDEHEEPSFNGYTYRQSVERASRKRRGSHKAKKALVHVKNTLQATINFARRNGVFDHVKTLHLEDNRNLKQGRRTSRMLSRHTWGNIRRKLGSISDELGVQVLLSWSGYKSQRCSFCGWTQKKNRKGKEFLCTSCGFSDDSDHNASMNAKVKLPWIPLGGASGGRKNIAGFFWNPAPDAPEWSVESRLRLDPEPVGYFSTF